MRTKRSKLRFYHILSRISSKLGHSSVLRFFSIILLFLSVCDCFVHVLMFNPAYDWRIPIHVILYHFPAIAVQATVHTEHHAGNREYATVKIVKEPYWPQSKRKPPATFRKTTGSLPPTKILVEPPQRTTAWTELYLYVLCENAFISLIGVRLSRHIYMVTYLLTYYSGIILLAENRAYGVTRSAFQWHKLASTTARIRLRNCTFYNAKTTWACVAPPASSSFSLSSSSSFCKSVRCLSVFVRFDRSTSNSSSNSSQRV